MNERTNQDQAAADVAQVRARRPRSRAADAARVADLLSQNDRDNSASGEGSAGAGRQSGDSAGADVTRQGGARNPVKDRKDRRQAPRDGEPGREHEQQAPAGEGPAAPPAGEGEAPAGELEAKAKPKTLKEAAAALGLEPAEMYGLTFELKGGGGSVTLGQIKDFIQEHGVGPIADMSALMAGTSAASEAAEQIRETATAEANQARRDLVGIIAAAGRVPPQVFELVRQQQARLMERELALTLEAAPEWRDAKVFSQDKADILKFLRPYGFTVKELDRVDDSRLLLFLRDALRARRAAARALDTSGENSAEGTQRAGRGEQSPASRTSLTQAQRNAVEARRASERPGGRASKVAAVSALLSGGSNGKDYGGGARRR